MDGTAHKGEYVYTAEGLRKRYGDLPARFQELIARRDRDKRDARRRFLWRDEDYSI